MAIRRFHQKSRSGCSRCKLRRVKCDEGQPICKNCIRQGTECVYGTSTWSEPSPPPHLAAPLSAATNAATYDSLDLLLMHRFATSTALDLFPHPEATNVWQHVIPIEAAKQPLLMHGILALAGMDMARTATHDPTESRYRTRALHHQQLGLAIFQDMLLLQGSGSKDIQATFPFSIILVVLAFAAGQSETPGHLMTVDAIMDLFALFRGPRTLAQTNWQAIKGSQLHALIGDKGVDQAVVLPEIVRAELTALSNHYAPDTVSAEAIKLLVEGIERSTRPFDLRAIGQWPSMMHDEFFMRLKERQPEALVILSHFSITLNAFRERWWIAAWDRMLLSAVDDALPLEQKERLGWSKRKMEGLLEVLEKP